MAATEAERLLRIARRDRRMALRLPDPDGEEASWGWALQQSFEKTLKAWLLHLGVKPPHSHAMARLPLLLEQADVEGECRITTTINRRSMAWIAQPGASGLRL